MATFNPFGAQTYYLNGSISSTQTSITLASFVEPVSGVAYTMALLNTDIAYATISPKTSSSEFISFTGITQNADGTATLTGVTRGLAKKYPFTASATFRLPHSGQSQFIISDMPQLFNKYMVNENAETVTGEKTFTLLPRSNGGNATDNTQLITYAQALALATGTASINRIVVAGNGGEVITAGNLVYLDVADGEWKKCDADTAGTVDNIILGIAQGAGTDGNPITNGILLFGLDSNQTGLTNNTAYYAGNTAGAISSTPGTTEVSVGISRSTTSLLFYPRYNQELTENQQDALLGNNGTPSGTNLYVTQTGLQRNTEVFAASSAGTDTYAITLSPVPAAYVQGMTLRFKADVANTGAATLNVNGLGSVDLQTIQGNALTTNEIVANQIVEVVYNSTGPSFRIVSQSALVSIAAPNPSLIAGVGEATVVKTYWDFQIPFIISTDVPTNNFWTTTNTTLQQFYSGIYFSVGADSVGAIITTNPIFIKPSTTTGSGGLLFSDNKDVITEFGVELNATGSEQMGWGLTEDINGITDYDNANVDAASFTVDTSGNLYGHTSNGAGGAAHTETLITGITLTDMNTYRIEFNPGVDVKFYVNGVLKATNTTNLPNSSAIYWGVGASGETGANDIMNVTAPWFAIEK